MIETLPSLSLSFVGLALLMSSVPGPSVLFVVSQGLDRDWRRSVAAVLGIALSNLVWVSLCVVGVASLMRGSAPLFAGLRWLGGCYLTYLGIRQLLHSSRSQIAGIAAARGRSRAFAEGFATSITNPKALVFYLSFLPQFVIDGRPRSTQLLLLGVSNVAVLTLVLSLYSALALRAATWLRSPAVSRSADRATGLAFLAFGASLLRFRRG